MFMFAPISYGKPVCLIGGLCVSHAKKYIIALHFTTNHSEINFKYPINSDSRKEFIQKKEGYLDTQRSFFTNANEHSKSIVFASYQIPLLLASKNKPFTDAEEIIKAALNISARILMTKAAKKI
ncbi:hypothetical protein RF11_07902 [Thelohanellus kitauei]|uniref:Uncharacterized protein n=1 Tax=Thelohanellus kitauei TaxID=669202 RepID=A0A0C2MNL7_THEKT|nr:hypothetical protein RF11_07902 [Thelohanellus kitauei]